MARTKKRRRVKSQDQARGQTPFHAFWSGSLSFGLVNVPVLVFPASRHAGVRLHLLSERGPLLERRFYCPRDGKEVAGDEIVRGYELDDGSYIVVQDRELEELEPEKTREIELRQFVDLTDLPPVLLERGYYLTPAKEGTKAYRLLAEAMERTNRAGIATFVMRDREYLVAIFARAGILCAETLRFHDEIRDWHDIGLADPEPPARQRVSAFARSIDALFTKRLSPSELADTTTEALEAIIARKKKSGRDLVRADRETAEADRAVDDDVDLLETIRRSLRHVSSRSEAPVRRAVRASTGRRAPRNRRKLARR
jgi:DNA end-binding protein Ku